MADFLLEIGLDEVPARMIAGAEAELGRRVNELLTRERLLAPEFKLATYSTPRRLAVLVEGVLASQTDTEEKLTGPSWKVAFKDGAPTKAAKAFAIKAGVAVEALEKVTNSKGEYVGATVKRQGRKTAELLAAELPKEVLGLYWAKNMYWRAGKPERFVRPVRWVVALLDSAVVPAEIAGIAAGNSSRGHRVLHGEHSVLLTTPKSYAEELRKAYVVVDVAERRQSIRKALDAATRTVAGARWREDEPLIETVVHLTEWPTVILGSFETEYLALPEEVLVTVMRDHQKYFAVEGPDGKLLPHFLAVLNIQVDEEGYATIRHGNQKVLRARFKDARFFWEVDQKTPLVDRVESLNNVTFQKELGSYAWKTRNNWAAAEKLATATLSRGIKVDEAALRKATEVAKTDLTTELVKEFTELQGIIGGLYARAQGCGESVAQAIYDQYTPASIEDRIPNNVEGQLFGIADRIQTIVSMFGIRMVPTGSKDPFALRRAANAIVKILAESGLPLTLTDVLDSYTGIVYADRDNKRTDISRDIDSDETLLSVRAFLGERLSFYLKDVRGFAYDVVNAVLAAGGDDVRDTIARAESLTAARQSEDFAAISAAFKRIKNILRQAEEKGFALCSPKDVTLAPEAQQLADAAAALAPEVALLRGERAYDEALARIATLRPVVDAFFDKVMVLDPDPAVRGAHLGLIDGVLRGFSGIADFSEIVTG
ncbi:MAG: glycine--tRNA ligase subunit beta [Terracidiphilus sp.]|jgi:glycyl-tRNA synthetase beta chain